MTTSEIVKANVEEAKIKNPQLANYYDIAVKVYESMSPEEHSGMSWSFTRSIVMNLIKIIPKECFLNNDIIILKTNTIEWVESYIKDKIADETNINEKDILNPYVSGIYKSALITFKTLIENVNFKTELLDISYIFNKLANCQPLIPIEDIPENWNECPIFNETSKDLIKKYQCNKMSSLFKEIDPYGNITYHDNSRSYCSEINIDENGKETESTYSNWMSKYVDLIWPIKMPYMPEDKKYKINVENFVDGEDEYVLIKSIDTPSGKHRIINESFQYIEINKPDSKFPETVLARMPYSYFLKLKNKDK